MRSFLLLTVVTLAGTLGCESAPPPRSEPVDVTATVTGADGKPLPASLAVILQPTGDTLPTRLTSTGSGFTGKAMPGSYVYYINSAKGESVPVPKEVPAKYTSPAAENTVEVKAGEPLTITLTN